MATGWDQPVIHYSDQQLASSTHEPQQYEKQVIQEQFYNFLRTFRSNGTFTYRSQIRSNCRLGRHFVEVDLADLAAEEPIVSDQLKNTPTQLLPQFEKAATRLAREENRIQLHSIGDVDDPMDEAADSEASSTSGPSSGALKKMQVIVTSKERPIPIRNLTAVQISSLVVIQGIVVSASRTRPKATRMTIMCSNCHATTSVSAQEGFSHINLPIRCTNQASEQPVGGTAANCPLDPYVVLPDRCTFVDCQTLKLQESPETVPTGEMPRHVILSCERNLVDRVVPGTRVTVMGVYSTMEGKSADAGNKRKERGGVAGVGLRTPYLHAIGIDVDDPTKGSFSHNFTPEEEEEFANLGSLPDLYSKITRSIAPAIYGMEDIKKAIACQLFGGSRKHLPDGMRLRGDVNILLLGDPGTAKSQTLKFVEKVAPIAVYTSGKGSSAAGLTASVVRDPSSREFYLEGGAMVLADQGVVCIDEFDKMNTNDRVAIHEAMEQQTISVAKAGITTMLNSRTSVLAAANPVFGRYDDMRQPFENIEFQSTILSRFDLIFLIKDVRNELKDRVIAQHVIGIHMKGQTTDSDAGEIDMHLLKRYISYCRAKYSPRLSKAAADALQNHYVSFRSSLRDMEQSHGRSMSIPITVRQLEAIIRITESLARMQQSQVAREEHLTEAIRLFKASTIDAAAAGITAQDNVSPAVQQEIEHAENMIKLRLPIGASVSEQRLISDLSHRNVSVFSVRMAIRGMVQREELLYRNQRKTLKRKS